MQSSTENIILAALIESKEAYEEFKRVGNVDGFSPINKAILTAVSKYRERDSECSGVNRALLEQQLLRNIRNDKHVEPLRNALRSIPSGVSVDNVREHIKALHRQTVGQKLSLALANQQSDAEVRKLIEEYEKGSDAVTTVSESSLVDVLDTTDLTEEKQEHEYIKLWPKSVNDRLDGGCLRGHHVLIFARPETGKTLFAINLVCGFISQGLACLYVGNEEPAADIRDRLRGRLLRVSKAYIRKYPQDSARKLSQDGKGSVRITEGTNFSEVRALLRGGQFQVLILDQIRNMRLKSDSRTAELEAAGIEARAIAKEFNVLVVSITQAGDSATNKIYLEMSDVDSSKTGIPASADLMVGIGADEAMKASGTLGISLPKNKLSGLHDRFTVNVNYSTGVID